MLGTPFTAGIASSSLAAAAYAMTVSTPVPPGAAVIVFAGASGATTATGVTDSQGNAYTLAASSTANEYLQAFTATAVTGLNAADTWTVTYGASNTQAKQYAAIAVTGAAAVDIAVAANGSSATASATGTAAGGNETAIACWQSGGAVPSPGSAFTFLNSQSGGMSCAYGYAPVTRAGPVAASAAVTSGPWAAVLVTLPAAAPVALGSGSSPASGAAQLPPFPVLPAPRTWSPGDTLLAPELRADPGNALLLLANPPLVVAGQTTTTQAVATGTVTALELDTENLDTWQSHTIPGSVITPPLDGWYLAEGFVFLNDTVTGSAAAAGLQVVQGGTTASSDGGRTSDNGVNFPVPVVADLVKMNPATTDTIALYCEQDSGAGKDIASAWLKTEWVAASSGTVITSPVPAAGWTSGTTALLAAVTAGAASVLVTDPTGIVTNGTISLDYGNAAAENATVTSVSGQTIGISACAYPHPAAAPVSVPVSAAFMNQQVRDKIRFLSWKPFARLSSQGGTQTLATQSWPAGTAVNWMNPASTAQCADNFSGWNSTLTSQYTFPVSGTWYLYGQVYLADAASPVLVSAGLAVSGGTIRWGDRTLSAGSTSKTVCATVRRTVRVAAGQYIEVYGSQGSGGSLSVMATASQHCRLVAVWRGF